MVEKDQNGIAALIRQKIGKRKGFVILPTDQTAGTSQKDIHENKRRARRPQPDHTSCGK